LCARNSTGHGHENDVLKKLEMREREKSLGLNKNNINHLPQCIFNGCKKKIKNKLVLVCVRE
jgi:hypothetical protein